MLYLQLIALSVIAFAAEIPHPGEPPSLISEEAVRFDVPEVLNRLKLGLSDGQRRDLSLIMGRNADVTDISVSYVGKMQLDRDPAAEFVCELRLQAEVSWLLIFNQTSQGWNRHVFGFPVAPNWPRALKGLSNSPNGAELVIESLARGSGIATSWVSILKVHENTVAEVLSVNFGQIQSRPRSSFRQRLRTDNMQPGLLYVSNPVLASATPACAAYRWSSAKFAYELDPVTPCSPRATVAFRPLP